MPTETDYAWAAGFFDGEGSVSATKTQGRYIYLHFSVGQAESVYAERPQVLVKFHNIFKGFCHIFGPYYSYKKPMYHVRSQNPKNIQAMYEKMWPYLSDVKKDQYKQALEVWTNREHQERKVS